jgi:uncharacterized membrane protein YoaK (UPF0700 family)
LFLAKAHSPAQQARLAITLAWVAGYTNIIALIVCGHVVSHMSGTASDLGLGVARGDVHKVGLALALLAAFLAGAIASGLSTELGRRSRWRSIYIAPMAIEAALLIVLAIGVELHDPSSVEVGLRLYALSAIAALAMGVQNATITRISNGVVRTTHVTGVVTDLGLELAHAMWRARDRARSVIVHHLRHDAPASRAVTDPIREGSPGVGLGWRVALLASIFGSFSLGAGLGAVAYGVWPAGAMIPPLAFLLFIIGMDAARPIAEVESSSVYGGSIAGLPSELRVFHLRRRGNRAGVVHRLPDLQSWADRLASDARVVVLDLGDVAALDADGIDELHALCTRLAREDRSIVLAGMSGEECRLLSTRGIDPAGLCPDLELAIAHALNLHAERHAVVAR